MEYYNETIAANAEVEVIHINRDRSEEAMVAFMTDHEMPWPAVVYDKRDDFSIAMEMYRRAVPQYTLIDGEGAVLAEGLPAIQAKVEELSGE